MGYFSSIRRSASVYTQPVNFTVPRAQQTQQQGQSQSFYPRVSNRINTPVERFEVSKYLDGLAGPAAGIVGYASTVPARVLETPLALLNQGIVNATGGRTNGLDLFREIGNIGIRGGPSVGGVLGAVGGAVDWVGNLFAAGVNAQDVRLIKENRGKPDDTLLPEWTEGPPILGAFAPWLGRQKTLGELKAELGRRGFGPEDFEDIMSGRKGDMDFGDRMINDSPMVDLAVRLVADPFNLLFVIPPLGAAVKGTRGASILASFGARTQRALRATGMRQPIPRTIDEGVDALRNQDVTNVSKASLGRFVEMSSGQWRKDMADRFPDLLSVRGAATAVGRTAKFIGDPRGYLSPRGYLRRSAVLYGTTAALANFLPEDGFLASIRSFSEESLARQPLSSNSAFVLATALATPIVPELSGTVRGAGMLAWKSRFYEGIPDLVPKRFKNEDGTPMTMEQLGQQLGGMDRLDRLLFGFAATIAAKRKKLPIYLLGHQDTMQQMGKDFGDVVTPSQAATVRNLMEDGTIKPTDLFDMWEDTVRNPKAIVDDIEISDLGIKERGMKGVGFEWGNGTIGIRMASRWLEDMEILGKAIKSNSEYTLGLRGPLTKEEINYLHGWVGENMPERVPLARFHEFVADHESLLMSAQRQEWAQLITRESDPNATIPRQEILDLLDQQRAHSSTPTAEMYFADDKRYEINAVLRTPLRSPTAITDLRQMIETLKMPDGSIRPGVEGNFEALTRRFNAAVAWRVRNGVRRGAGTIDNTRQALLSELRYAEGRPNLAGEADRIRAALSKLENAGTVVGPQDFLKFMEDMDKSLKGLDITPRRLAGKAPDSIERLQGTGYMPDLKALEQLAPEGDYVYHLSPSSSFDSIRDQGLKPGKIRKGEETGVYFGAQAFDLYSLIPQRHAKETVLFRVRRSDADLQVTDIYKPESGIQGEFVSKEPVPPSVIEVLDESNNWRRLAGGDMLTMPSPMPDARARPTDWMEESIRQIDAHLRDSGSPYAVVRKPREGYVTKPTDTLPEIMYKQRNVIMDWLMGEGGTHRIMGRNMSFTMGGGYFNFPTRFIRYLLSPVRGAKMNTDTVNALNREMIGMGFRPKDIDAILDQARVLEERALNIAGGRRGIRLYPSLNSINRSAWDRIINDTFPGNPEIVQKLNASGGMAGAIDRASSRLLRDMRRRIGIPEGRGLRAHVERGALRRTLDIYYNYRSGNMLGDAPLLGNALQNIQHSSRLVANTMYHLFRFMTDARWLLVNHYEQQIMGLSLEGMRAKPGAGKEGMSRAAEQMASQEGMPRLGERRGEDIIDPITSKEIVREATAENMAMVEPNDMGWRNNSLVLTTWVGSTFDAKRPSTTLDVLQKLWDNDPILLRFRRDFPDASPKSLAERLNDQMYGIDSKGARNYISEEYRRQLAEETGRSEWDVLVDQVMLDPIVNRISEAHQMTYDSMVKTMVGDPDRTNLERLMNSYWLYWPISYQLRAARWLTRMLTHRAFGNNTNLLGAWKYAQMKEYFYNQLQNNEEFKKQMEDNFHIWMVATMLFPITPEDVGVSLNRALRVAGQGIVGVFDPTFEAADPFSMWAYAATIGPVYTVQLLERLGKEFFPEPTFDPLIQPGPEGHALLPTLLADRPDTQEIDVGAGAPITAGRISLPGTQMGGSVTENPFEVQTWEEGGEWLPQDEYEKLLEERERFEQDQQTIDITRNG